MQGVNRPSNAYPALLIAWAGEPAYLGRSPLSCQPATWDLPPLVDNPPHLKSSPLIVAPRFHRFRTVNVMLSLYHAQVY